MSPRPSLIPTSEESSTYTGDSLYKSSMQQEQSSHTQPQQQSNGNKDNNNKANKSEPAKRNRALACRVCLKGFKPDDFQKICFECHQKVCEDCASYSKLEENEDEVRTLFLWLYLFQFYNKLFLPRVCGSAVFAGANCHLGYVYHRTPPNHCWMCQLWRHYGADIRMLD